MTLKEELEILRGEPIRVFTGDPMDIPCIETSDPEKLCQHPVVSVNMITYNHEPYIRQAIEGVMMQKTDFEFELVIGEDCSTDKTREICFEYQKKYPDKIRVLWCDHNLYSNPHPAGANGRRNMAHCRGEFIALCEGDDYWIDPLKLQKQVDVMRHNPSVGLCFTGARIYREINDQWSVWDSDSRGFKPGFLASRQYMLGTMIGLNPYVSPGPEVWQMTASFLFRKDVWNRAVEKNNIFYWRLSVGDSVLCLGLASMADVYYLRDETVVYRQMLTGVTCRPGSTCGRDTWLVRLYYFVHSLHLDPIDFPDVAAEELYRQISAVVQCCGMMRRWSRAVKKESFATSLFGRPRIKFLRFLDLLHLPSTLKSRLGYYFSTYIMPCHVSNRLLLQYEKFAPGKVDKRCGMRKRILMR